MANSFQLDPNDIKEGMTVYWPSNGNPSLMRSSFTVMAVQFPLIVLGWPGTQARWIIDANQETLIELSEGMIKALNTAEAGK